VRTAEGLAPRNHVRTHVGWYRLLGWGHELGEANRVWYQSHCHSHTTVNVTVTVTVTTVTIEREKLGPVWFVAAGSVRSQVFMYWLWCVVREPMVVPFPRFGPLLRGALNHPQPWEAARNS